MTKRNFIKSFLAIIFLCAVVYGVSLHSGTIRYFIASNLHMPSARVLGMSDKTLSMPEKMQADIQAVLNAGGSQVMHLTIGQIVGTVSRVQKVIEDFRGLQEATKQQVKDFSQKTGK